MKLIPTSGLPNFKNSFCVNILCKYYMPGSELGSREVKGKESQRLMFSEKEQPVQPSKITPVSKDLDQRYKHGTQ